MSDTFVRCKKDGTEVESIFRRNYIVTLSDALENIYEPIAGYGYCPKCVKIVKIGKDTVEEIVEYGLEPEIDSHYDEGSE